MSRAVTATMTARLYSYIPKTPVLERQIFCRITTRKVYWLLWCWLLWCYSSRLTHWLCLWIWLCARWVRYCLWLANWLTWHDSVHAPCTYIIVPSALILTCIDIEEHVDFLAQLDVKLIDLIFSKHIETHATRVLFVRLNHIVLHLPWVSRCLTNAASCFKYGNDSSC